MGYADDESISLTVETEPNPPEAPAAGMNSESGICGVSYNYLAVVALFHCYWVVLFLIAYVLLQIEPEDDF